MREGSAHACMDFSAKFSYIHDEYTDHDTCELTGT
jgi:hypothetical protein